MKKLKFKSWALGLVLLSPAAHPDLRAREAGSNLSMGTDLVSRYIWRGLNTGGPGAHFQPWLEYRMGQTGVALGAWGSYSLGSGTGTEVDLYLSYTPVSFLTIGVTDYFFPADAAFGSSSFFDYGAGTTGHTLEAMISFNGLKDFPLSVLFAMNFYGADGTDENGDNYLAKYLELSYAFAAGETTIVPVAGMALDDPREEESAVGWYGNSAGLIQAGFTLGREIKITEHMDLPVSIAFLVNPEAENIYLVLTIGFTF